ncbi:hypothetical protein V5799_004526, partial [Amblyomma americanum]
MFVKPLFYIVAVTHLIFFYVINLHTSITVDTILSKGIPGIFGITIVPSVSILDCVGRVLMPLATESGYVKRSTLVMVDYLCTGVGFVAISFVQSYPAMLITCISFAVFSGHAVAVHNSLMGDFVGAEQVYLSNAIVTCIAAASFLTKPFVVGFFRDQHGSYDNLYRVMSGLMFLNALVWLAVNLTESIFLLRNSEMEEKEPKKTSTTPALSHLCCRCTPADENWLMAASCIAVTFLTGGTLRSTGILFVLLREQFGLSREEAAWPLSLSSAAVAFSGILCQILLRWCARGHVLLFATFCQLAGIFAAHYAPTFPMLAAAFGITHGIGSGLVFVLAGSFIERHFTTKRRLIMHLNIAAFCGAGVVFPGLLLYVAGRFGRDKVLLFCAGFLFNVPLLSIFM